MLRERPELYNDLDDIEYLGSLPEGSLGKAIWEFYTSENLSAEGLKAASEAARDDKPADTDPHLYPSTHVGLFTKCRI